MITPGNYKTVKRELLSFACGVMGIQLAIP
jgi:hypothetical protein